MNTSAVEIASRSTKSDAREPDTADAAQPVGRTPKAAPRPPRAERTRSPGKNAAGGSAAQRVPTADPKPGPASDGFEAKGGRRRAVPVGNQAATGQAAPAKKSASASSRRPPPASRGAATLAGDAEKGPRAETASTASLAKRRTGDGSSKAGPVKRQVVPSSSSRKIAPITGGAAGRTGAPDVKPAAATKTSMGPKAKLEKAMIEPTAAKAAVPLNAGQSSPETPGTALIARSEMVDPGEGGTAARPRSRKGKTVKAVESTAASTSIGSESANAASTSPRAATVGKPAPRAASSKTTAARSGSGVTNGCAPIKLGFLSDFVGFHLRLAQDASYRAFARFKEKDLVKPGRFPALAIIHLNPGISQSALGRAIARDKSTVSPLIKDLQKNGFINRKPSPNDRRSVTLNLTKKGERVLERLHVRAREHENDLDRLVGGSKGKLVSLLDKITAALTA